MRLSILLILGLFYCLGLNAQVANFNRQFVSNGWTQACGFTFDENGRTFVWLKEGKVYIVDENGNPLPQPLIDISEEVVNWRDHGLLGFALHPNFLNNGYFFLYYAVDKHYLLYHGTVDYDPNIMLTEQATIARITRYTADPTTNFTTTIPNSRLVLLGESISTGIPLLHQSHGVGTLSFGQDGSLLVSAGDGSSYSGSDYGGNETGSYANQALQDGIIDAQQDIGSFRAQSLHSLNGKILRLDPNTGDGLASNPFYNSQDVRSPQSRIWAMGFRNPFRFAVQPHTGEHDPALGKPGVLYVGDVGSAYWEEINVVDSAGQNFGWPVFEGMERRYQYNDSALANPYAPNPLPSCGGSYLSYQSLIVQEELGVPQFPHPCDSTRFLPDSLPLFVHQRPMMSWSNFAYNNEEQNTYIPGYWPDGRARSIPIEDPDSPVDGPKINGSSAIAGFFYEGGNWPWNYQGSFYLADFKGWITELEYDSEGRFERHRLFFYGDQTLIHIAQHPIDGCLYFLRYGTDGNSAIHKICYGGNIRPSALITYDQQYGPSPLSVQFDGGMSFDPDSAQTLDYFWEFGDGSSSTEINPSHTFLAPDGQPKAFEVSLRVTDPEGASHKAEALISLNNTPPEARIVSLKNGDTYSPTGISEFSLQAETMDQEQESEALSYRWQTFLQHNTHNHSEPAVHEQESSVLISGEGCGEEAYWYRIALTVTDNGGLSAYDEVELFPNCGDPNVDFLNFRAGANESRVILEWEVEEKGSGIWYEIQRSDDRLHFTSLGQLTADGSSQYQWEDVNPKLGNWYYRIKAIEQEGFYSFSEISQISFPGKADILPYPNPVTDSWSIDFRIIYGQAICELYDLQGRLALRKRWISAERGSTQSVDVSRLSPGMYLYRIDDGQSQRMGKVVVRP